MTLTEARKLLPGWTVTATNYGSMRRNRRGVWEARAERSQERSVLGGYVVCYESVDSGIRFATRAEAVTELVAMCKELELI